MVSPTTKTWRAGIAFGPKGNLALFRTWFPFFVLALGLLGVMNWVVDPYGDYGNRTFPSAFHNTRREKVDLFERLVERPDGLILGSSRTLKFEPEYLESKTGLSFFNFGVHYGRPEDFLAMVRMYRARYGQMPRELLIGIDVSAMRSQDDAEHARLSNEPRLCCLLPERHSIDALARYYATMFSITRSGVSLKAICRGLLTKQKSPAEFFAADGLVIYHERMKQMESGCYDFESAMQSNQREFCQTLGGVTELSESRWSTLESLLKLCRDCGCHVRIFTTVTHPSLRSHLYRETSFESLEKSFADRMALLASKYEVSFVDLSSIDRFGGERDAFVDGIHPLEANTRKMIDRIYTANQAGPLRVGDRDES